MTPSNQSVDGLLLVDKPAGLTSHDVVLIVRRAYGERSIGHLGTLDPFATGLLVLLLGRCTRLATFIDNEPKEYLATIKFGQETDTDDLTGTVIREAPLPASDTIIDEAIQALTGDILQIPSSYSAKKVDGERAYAIARDGKEVELAPVPITVHEWRILDRRADELDVAVVCGGGTYIRALARDLGRATNSAAHLWALRRVRSGEFDVRNATTIDALKSGEVPKLFSLRVVAER